MLKLTELEKIALVDLWRSSKGNGHDFGYADDLPSIQELSRGGVVASLSKKGLIYVDPGCDGLNWFEFSELGRSLFSNFFNSPLLK